jgi:CBS domain-containing protein
VSVTGTVKPEREPVVTMRQHATSSTSPRPSATAPRRARVEDIYRPRVVTAAIGDTLEDAARRMRDEGVSALVVLDGERVAGIVTERDVTGAAAEHVDAAAVVLADHLTADPVTVELDTDAREAAELMRELEIRHLPVVDAGEVVGMVSARDLLDLEAATPSAGS